jgi:hypothetical protein
MRPEIIDLGQKLAFHMINEDVLFKEIINFSLTEEEASFLEQCILKDRKNVNANTYTMY